MSKQLSINIGGDWREVKCVKNVSFSWKPKKKLRIIKYLSSAAIINASINN